MELLVLSLSHESLVWYQGEVTPLRVRWVKYPPVFLALGFVLEVFRVKAFVSQLVLELR